MTPPRSLIGVLSNNRFMRRPWWRRSGLLLLVLLFIALTLFPQRYRAATTMTPSDPSSLGLGATLGQLSAVNTAFGNQAAVEVSLRVARSVFVRDTVMRRLNIVKLLDFANEIDASRWLDRRVKVRTLRGGILLIETWNADPVLGRNLVVAFEDATRSRLAEIARRQTAYKRGVLEQLVREASNRVTKAERTYNRFRLGSRFADPRSSFGAINARIPALQSAILGKETELATERKFATDSAPQVQAVLAQLASLRGQLAEAQKTDPTNGTESTGQVVRQSTEVRELERELMLAQGLYDGYRRYLEGAAVEDLTSTATIRVLEAPYVDTQRQYNMIPAGIAVLLIMLGLAIEFYQWRPPVGEARWGDV